MAVVQSTYLERIVKAYAGMVANENPYQIDTRTVEPSSGLPFGRAVKQGANDKGVGLGGALTAFAGVSIRDVTLAPVTADSDYLDEYPQYANAGILTMGAVWVMTAGTVAAGGVVHYDTTSGIFAASGGIGPIPGARWMTSVTGAGLAVVRISGLQRT